MVVLAIASVAILVAFATSISASSEHRALASFDTALRSAYQDATSQIQYSASAHYVSCATASTYQNQVSFNNLPAGYTAQITSVTYWNAPSVFLLWLLVPSGFHLAPVGHDLRGVCIGWCQFHHQRSRK